MILWNLCSPAISSVNKTGFFHLKVRRERHLNFGNPSRNFQLPTKFPVAGGQSDINHPRGDKLTSEAALGGLCADLRSGQAWLGCFVDPQTQEFPWIRHKIIRLG